MESGEDEVASQVFSLCTSGDAKTLKALYHKESYVKTLIQLTQTNEANSKKIGEKTIFTATLRGHYDVTQFLLDKEVNPNIATALGTPIYAAVKSGSLDMMKLLVRYDANFRIRGGFSPVYIACIEGKLSILKYLVSIGADVFAFDNPPLVFTACSAGKLDILSYLMEVMDYDVHRTIHGEDALRTDGRDTLLYTACQRGKTDVAQYLMAQGAYITQTITNTFPQIIKAILRDKFRPVGKPDPFQMYQARLKEMGLAEIPWGVLADYTSCLTRLELRSNYLTSLPDKIFQLPVLKNLDISHNRLPEICQEEVIWECRSLTDFDASHNQLTYIPSGLFLMPELTTIQLSYNLLNHLPGDPEDPSAQTTTGLPADIRWICEKLKRLDLSHNRLHSLPDTFSDLRRLNVLMLSHNSLKELPPSCSWGCINLVQLDCTMNQLIDLPIGCANSWMHSLERLHLAHNQFTQISRNITELTHLTVLDLSHNNISTLPPTSWWSVNRLMKLQLNHNKLDVLSHKNEGGRDRTQADNERRPTAFRVLDALRGRGQQAASPEPQSSEGETQPRELPAEQWASSLQSLYLHSNRLKWLPSYLGKLSALTRLDISSNPDLKSLPLALGRLHNCWELTLHGLNLSNVPHHLMPGVRGGSAKRLLAYLRAQLRHCEPYNRMKLMAVGLQGRGKTTLLSVLRSPTSPLPENVSTVGVEVAEWTLSPPAHVLRGIRRNQPLQRHQMEVIFSTWDLAGQEVYYATHQCFLSRNTLYLVVWSIEEGDKGVEYLRPWLLNIQARAPHSPVLIVGTHLDKLPFHKAQEMKQKYKEKIKSLYGKAGFPNLSAIMFVASTTQEGIKDLQERIHHAAISAIDHDTRDPIIGMQVPASYINLQRLIAEEVRSCQEKGIPPVLSQKEFAVLADQMSESDICDPEELSLAAQFLHDNGVLLHYNDHLRGLNNLYFIDPVWLADLLAEVVTVPQRQNFVHNGILRESNVAFIFHDHRRFPSRYFPQYLQLLERFEIALSLGNNQRLIPSMLPMERPAINFTDPPVPEPQAMDGDSSKITPRSDVRATLTGRIKQPDNLPVMSGPVNCIRRRYKMAYTPSGFWSRLISRLIINLKRSGLMEEQSSSSGQTGPPIIYWRRGIVVIHSGGRFIVESIQTTAQPTVMGTQEMEASAKYVGEGVDLNIGLQGVDLTVWSFNGDFSAMGYVVDHLDSLIDEWFPGLNDLDVEGEWLVQRQVLWKVPSELKNKSGHKHKPRREQWALHDKDDEKDELVTFQLDTCAAEALIGDTIICRDYNVRVLLKHLVPDLLLTDLPADFKIDQTQLEFNPKDPATRLGRGGAGAVYKGKYRRQLVAVKEFLTAEQAEHTGETELSQRTMMSDEDVITSGEALFMFRDLRQEVTVLAQLDHPYIVALLGVSIHPMCMVIELAPMGSLFGILDKKVEEFRAAQEDRASACLRMPGGVLSHEVSTKIALQVAMALRYLHSHGVVYRDLKSDNVLVWSLDPNDPVNVKLADYGISRFANPGGVKGEEGTPGYLAPEAIRRRGEDQAFDEKVDIFSYAMLLFELLTGQRPFESLTTTQELNKAVSQGERPLVAEGNLDPAFPGMEDLMYDCWKQSALERPSASEAVLRVCEPGFLCRKHTITKSKDHPLQKIDTIYARPIFADDMKKSYQVWTWARQDTERNFSIIDARKGVYNLPEKSAPGGRVYAMTATGEIEKRIWIGTSDCEIQVYGYRNVGDPQCLWTFVMKDSVLSLSTELEGGRVKRVFASLANGTLCVFSRTSTSPDPSAATMTVGDAKLIPEACTIKCEDQKYHSEAEDWSNPLILKLDERSKSAKCMVFVGTDKLWCGCGNTITVVDIDNMMVIHHIPVFVKRMALVNELVSNGIKVWGVGRQLSCVMEWDAVTYKLLHVFNCNEIDSTGNNVKADPSNIEDLIDPGRSERDSRPAGGASSPSPQPPEETPRHDSFSVHNDPTPASSHAPFSTMRTRQTLRVVKSRPRRAAMTSQQTSDSPKAASRSRLLTARNRVLRRQQGSTRTTSLVVVDKTLWVGRGMGDVLVIDITDNENSHGTVLARLTMDDSEKYGNRSHHKLQYVAGEYVVSSQWLEPIELRRASAPTTSTTGLTTGEGAGAAGGGGGGGGGGGAGGLLVQLSDAPLVTHQAITIWEGWNQDDIKRYILRRDAILTQEVREEESDSV